MERNLKQEKSFLTSNVLNVGKWVTTRVIAKRKRIKIKEKMNHRKYVK